MNTLPPRPNLARTLSLMTVLGFSAAGAGAAGFALPPFFTDNMVLQQNDRALDDTHIWGWADKGETIRVEFQKNNVSTSVKRDGTWRVTLPKLDTNLLGSDLIIRNRAKEVLAWLTNVVVGEVWVLGVPAPAIVEFHPARLENFVNTLRPTSEQRFRVFALSQGTNATAGPADPSGWRVAQPEDGLLEARRFSNHAAYLAQGILANRVRFVGIIEAPRNDVVTRASIGKDLPRRNSSIEHGFVDTSLIWPAVRDARDARARFLTNVANLKRIGLVTNAPPPPPPMEPFPQQYSQGPLPGLDFAVRGCLW